MRFRIITSAAGDRITMELKPLCKCQSAYQWIFISFLSGDNEEKKSSLCNSKNENVIVWKKEKKRRKITATVHDESIQSYFMFFFPMLKLARFIKEKLSTFSSNCIRNLKLTCTTRPLWTLFVLQYHLLCI